MKNGMFLAGAAFLLAACNAGGAAKRSGDGFGKPLP